MDATPREGHHRILQPSESTSPPYALRLILNKDHLLVFRVDLKRRFHSILYLTYNFCISDSIWIEREFDQRLALLILFYYSYDYGCIQKSRTERNGIKRITQCLLHSSFPVVLLEEKPNNHEKPDIGNTDI